MKNYSKEELYVIYSTYRDVCHSLWFDCSPKRNATIQEQMKKIANWLNHVIIVPLREEIDLFENSNSEFMAYDGNLCAITSRLKNCTSDPFKVKNRLSWYLSFLRQERIISKEDNEVAESIFMMLDVIDECERKRTENYYKDY